MAYNIMPLIEGCLLVCVCNENTCVFLGLGIFLFALLDLWCYLLLYRKPAHRYSSDSNSSDHNDETTKPSVPAPPPSLASHQPAPKKVKTWGAEKGPRTQITVNESTNRPSSSADEHRQLFSACSTQPSEQCSMASPPLDSVTPIPAETAPGLCSNTHLGCRINFHAFMVRQSCHWTYSKTYVLLFVQYIESTECL